MIRRKIIAFIVGLIVSAGSCHTAVASPLFDATTANLWLLDEQTGTLVGYNYGYWLDGFLDPQAAPVFNLAASQVALVNGLPNSSLAMTSGQPAISIVGLDIATYNISDGEQGFPDLAMQPAEGVYQQTVVVQLRLNATVFENQSRLLAWTVNSGEEQTYLLDKDSAEQSGKLQDGYFTHNIALARNGTYVFNAQLRPSASDNTILASLIQTYTLNVPADDLRRDSDGDGIPDVIEVEIGLDPLTNDIGKDSDGDGWSDFDEWLRRFCLDDNNNPIEGTECLNVDGNPLDSDSDTWSDFDEKLRGTNPNDPQPYASTEPDFEINPGTGINTAGFCVDDDRFYFDVQITSSKTDPDPVVDVSFTIAADGDVFVRPSESISVNFQPVSGEITRQEPNAATYADWSDPTILPEFDRFTDGLITDFNLELVAPGRWRMTGSAAHGPDRFYPGDQVEILALREFGPITNFFGSNYNIEACSAVLPDASGLTDAQFRASQRFKDFPDASRLYEVEHVISTGVGGMIVPAPASLIIDQSNVGTMGGSHGGNPVQSFVPNANNLAGVDVELGGGDQPYDDIILNVWADPLRTGIPLVSHKLEDVPTAAGTIVEFRFAPVAVISGDTYYLEFRQQQASFAFPSDNNPYSDGALIEAAGATLADDPGNELLGGSIDLLFATYSDTAFSNGVGGTPTGMEFNSLSATDINGNSLYQQTRLLSADEIAAVGLAPGDIAARKQRQPSEIAMGSNLLPDMRLRAGTSSVIVATHLSPSDATVAWQAEPGYSRSYKYWLPRSEDISPLSMFDELGEGAWTTAEQYRAAFITYLANTLTVDTVPMLDRDSTAAIALVEAALSEEARLQSKKAQLFSSEQGSNDGVLLEEFETAMKRFATETYNLDALYDAAIAASLASQPLEAIRAQIQSLFFASKPGTRSDTYIAQQLQRDFNADCFVSNDDLASLQADTIVWNAFLDRCPEYFSEAGLDLRMEAEQLRHYLLRLNMLPGAADALADDASLLDPAMDSDADALLNLAELNQAAKSLTLPWLQDSDGDLIIDSADECPVDPFNQCGTNPLLPKIYTSADVTVMEPGTGTNNALVGITLDRLYDVAVTVYYQVVVDSGGSPATAGEDFEAITGSVVIAAGQLTAVIEVPVFADVDTEGAETFVVEITGADNAVPGDDGSVIVTLNDVVAPHTIGGNASGLTGVVVLQNNGGDDLSVDTNGAFTFATAIDDGYTYAVSVISQPADQSCAVSYFSGSATADVSNIAVNCTTTISGFTVGGNVSGLTGTLVLQNNNGDDLSIGADGDFTFVTAIADGLSYNVTVLTQPAGQACTPTDNGGTVNSSNITDVDIACVSDSVPTAASNFAVTATSPKTLAFSWDGAAGATSYKLLKNPDGLSGFTELITDITTLTAEENISVHIQDWVNASYMVQSCNVGGCTDSATITASSAMISAIGYFKASNSGTDDNFGISLALSADGQTMAVGARGEESNATGINGDQSNNDAVNAGAVYVFARSGNTWVQQVYLKASNAEAEDRFGRNLALSADGNTLVVGAYYESSSATGIDGDQSNNSAEYSGAVYVFTRSGVSWSQQAYVKASNAELDDQFGASLDLSDDGNTLAVGATTEASNATGINGNQSDNSAASGAVYVFIRNTGVWSQQAYIKASNTDYAYENFGSSVVLSSDGDTLVVGANGESSNATGINGDQSNNDAPNAGAVYVYARSVSTWSQQAYIKASNTDAGDIFGRSLALSSDGNTLAVGATNDDSTATGINGNQGNSSIRRDSGAVYVFIRNATIWAQQAYIKASNTGAGDYFGQSLALSADGDTLVVAAIYEASDATGINEDQTNDAASNSGAVYTFNRSVNVWSQSAYIKAPNTGLSDIFGFSLDLSSDGSALAIGASRESSNATGIGGDQTDNAVPQAGAVYLY